MDINAIRIDELQDVLWTSRNIKLSMLRLDLIHPLVSGNKWFKIFQNVAEMKANGATQLLTFGGAYSNHLHATAYYCQAQEIPCIGIVRGDELNVNSNATLKDCTQAGMELHFVSRSEYNLFENGKTAQALLQRQKTYILPQGGDNEWGRRGAMKINEFILPEYSHIAVSIGTGTTLAGMMQARIKPTHFLGFASLYQSEDIHTHLLSFAGKHKFDFFNTTKFGGFGATSQTVIQFVKDFQVKHDIELDVVYTAKMMMQLYEALAQDFFPSGSNILCVHTGGVQGNRSHF